MKRISDAAQTGPEHGESCCCTDCLAVNLEERGDQSPDSQSARGAPAPQNAPAAAEQLPQWGVLASDAYDEIADYINLSHRYFPIEPGGEITVDITGLTATGQQLARWALEAWAAVGNFTFREVADRANITFDDKDSGGRAVPPRTHNGFTSAWVNLPKAWIDKYGDEPGNWMFYAYLHEIGHALGLWHPGPYNNYPTPKYGLDNLFAADSLQTSVMSYFSQATNIDIDASLAMPVTPMMADILAIQEKYGVPETNPGNTVYGYQSNVGGYLGEVFSALTEQDGELGRVTLTLFDSGGEDRLDLRTDEADQRVDLRPEGVSDVYGLTGNWLIARGTVIENLVAGQGDDQVIANAAANELDGGPGSDTVSYVGSDAGVRVDLDAGTGAGGHAAGDALSNFEHVVGSAHADELRGDGGANRLAGGAGDDALYGNAGADTLDGGAGNDRLYGHAGDDRLRGGRGADTLDGGAGADTLEGGSGENSAAYRGSDVGVEVNLDSGVVSGGHAAGDRLISIQHLIGSAYADTLTGDADANRLAGGAGDDILGGGAGNDVLNGGAGADTLAGGAGDDTASYADSDARVRVNLHTEVVSGGDAEGDTLSSIEHVIGSAYADKLTGDTGANRLAGGAGDDRLYGSAGDDVLVGGAGADTLGGGAGEDTASYIGSAVGVRIDLDAGTFQGGDAVGDRLNSIERLEGSRHADHLAGSAARDWLAGADGDDRLLGRLGPDRLAGGAGDDTLEGGLGKDTLDGGAGYDTATYAGSAAGVRIDLKAGTFQGGDAAGDALTDIERIVGSAQGDVLWGSDGTDHLVGGAGDDELDGRPGDDTLAGGAGADVLDGGAGDDTVSYADSGAGVRVNLDTGARSGGDAAGDRFSSIESIIGSAHDDGLTGDGKANRLDGGAGDDTLRGGDGDDVLAGGAGDDKVYGEDGDDLVKGGPGADTLDGAGGDDTLSYGDSDEGVKVDLYSHTASGGHAEGDGIRGFQHLVGSAQADELRGDSGANELWGGAGDDELVGRAGGDWLYGEAGNDRLDGNGGDDELMGGAGDDELHGGADDDTLDGGADNDRLYGNEGDDTLDGGEGNDLLKGDSGEDVLRGGLNNDRLWGGADNDRLYGGAGNDRLKGDHGDDTLDGGAGNDLLYGGAGADTLDGGVGKDSLDGDSGDDTVVYTDSETGVQVDLHAGRATGGYAQGDKLRDIENLRGSAHADALRGDDGANRLWGGGGDDTLVGLSGNDWLYGEAGADRLSGSGGDDVLAGGAGADTFTYGGAADSSVANPDRIVDFSGSGGDGDMLSIPGKRFIGSAAFTGTAGEVRYAQRGADTGNDTGDDYTDVLVDLDGDGAAELMITLVGLHRLVTADFTLFTEYRMPSEGTAGADVLVGDARDNVLRGLAGDDVLVGQAGADTLDGGSGDDTAAYADSDAAVQVDLDAGTASGGHAQGDTLTSIENLRGSAHADVLRGDGSANRLWGGAGDDRLVGLGGHDRLYGEAGADRLFGSAGDDVLEGGAGADVLDGEGGTDTLSYAGSASGVAVNLATGTVSGGDAQGDTIASVENVLGSAQADVLVGDGSANRLAGGGGADTLRGAGGADTLTGGAGDDTLDGGAGSDTLAGGAGADTFHYSNAADSSVANPDRIVDFSGSSGDGDHLDLSGLGNDLTFIGTTAFSNSAGEVRSVQRGAATGSDTSDDYTDVLVDVDGNGTANVKLTLVGLHSLTLDDLVGVQAPPAPVVKPRDLDGTPGDDTLVGDAQDNTLRGLAGNDVLAGQAGADTLDGGSGDDTASYTDSDAAVQVDLDAGTATGGHAQGDTLTGIEHLSGSAHNDTLRGAAGANTLRGHGGDDVLAGQAGADRLEGGTGADTLDGGAGSDTLAGGAGADTFHYKAAADSTVANPDRIVDFSGSDGDGDHLDLSGLGNDLTFIGTTAFSNSAGEVRYCAARRGHKQ